MRRSCATCRWSCPVALAKHGDARDQNRLLTREQARGLACRVLEPDGPWFAMPPNAGCPRHEFWHERLWGWLLWLFAPWVICRRLSQLSVIALDTLGAAVDNGSAARCAGWSAWRGLVLARAASDVLAEFVPIDPQCREPTAMAHRALRTAVNAALMEARAAAWHPGLVDMTPSNIPSDLTVPAFGALEVIRPEEE